MSAHAPGRNKDQNLQHAQHVHYPFWFGGSASCFAASVTHPLDLGKLFAGLQAAARLC